MGIEIRGWIEFRDAALDEFLGKINWHGVIDLSYFLPRNTNAFGCLFGARNPSHFVPIAANRGIPNDVSEPVKSEMGPQNGFFHHSWITWQELTQVDWEESVLDAFVRRYKQDENGNWKSEGTFIPHPPIEYIEGASWQNGDTWNVIERISRADAVKGTFDLTFDLMKRLAQDYGDEFVRLVVWFVG